LSSEIFENMKKLCEFTTNEAEHGYGVTPCATGQNCENRHPARSPARVNPGVEPWVLRQALARPDWMEPFARTIDAAKKYVVSSTLDRVDWNAELRERSFSAQAGRFFMRQGGPDFCLVRPDKPGPPDICDL
jgi:hypothetical protein